MNMELKTIGASGEVEFIDSIMHLCAKHRVHHIKYRDVELVFMPEKMELPEIPKDGLDNIPSDDDKYNPDYLIENPPLM